jgi:hypothetical protein
MCHVCQLRYHMSSWCATHLSGRVIHISADVSHISADVPHIQFMCSISQLMCHISQLARHISQLMCHISELMYHMYHIFQSEVPHITVDVPHIWADVPHVPHISVEGATYPADVPEGVTSVKLSHLDAVNCQLANLSWAKMLSTSNYKTFLTQKRQFWDDIISCSILLNFNVSFWDPLQRQCHEMFKFWLFFQTASPYIILYQ